MLTDSRRWAAVIRMSRWRCLICCVIATLQPRFGGEPIWMGRALHSIIGDESWDIVILVRYPTRRQFLGMLDDPDYRAIAPIRAAVLADSRLIEMDQLLPAA